MTEPRNYILFILSMVHELQASCLQHLEKENFTHSSRQEALDTSTAANTAHKHPLPSITELSQAVMHIKCAVSLIGHTNIPAMHAIPLPRPSRDHYATESPPASRALGALIATGTQQNYSVDRKSPKLKSVPRSIGKKRNGSAQAARSSVVCSVSNSRNDATDPQPRKALPSGGIACRTGVSKSNSAHSVRSVFISLTLAFPI